MLDKHNILAKTFRMVKEAPEHDIGHNVSLRLIGKHNKDDEMYNLLTAEEVAILIVCDIKNLQTGKDIIVEHKNGFLKQINEHHISYLGL